MIGLLYGFAVVAAPDLVDRGDVIRQVVVQLRRALADRGFLVDNGGKYFIVDIDKPDRVVRHGLRLGDHEGYAFADETNPVEGDHRPVRDLLPPHYPVRNNPAALSGQLS